MIREWLYEEYKTDAGDLVVFECDNCGYKSFSLGGLHGHIEQHRGYTRWNIQLPFTKTTPANVDELMKRTNIYTYGERNEISLSEVKGL